MVIRTIKLTSLFVNTENYRFEPLSSQKEAIDKMIEDQGDKLYSLVDDIVTNGLSPVEHPTKTAISMLYLKEIGE